MKNMLLLALLSISTSLIAQNKIVGFSAYGRYGDPNSGGAIFESNPDGTDFKVLKNFVHDQLGRPDGDLILGPDHYFYGLEGRRDGHVTCLFFYRIDPNDWSRTLLRKIEGVKTVRSPLVWGDDGFFYFCGATGFDAQGSLMRATLDGQTIENLVALPTTSESYGLQKISSGVFALALPDNRLVSYTVGDNHFIVLKQFGPPPHETLDYIGVGNDGVIYGALKEYLPQSIYRTRLFRINFDGANFSFIQTTPADTDFGDVKDILFWNDSTLYTLSPRSNNGTHLYRVNLHTGQTHSLYANMGNIEPSKLTRSSDDYLLFSTYTGASMGAIWKAKPDGSQLIKYQIILPQELGLVGKVEELSDGSLCMKAGAYDYDYSIQPGSVISTNNVVISPSRILKVNADGCCLTTAFSFGEKPSLTNSPNNLIKGSDGKYYGTVYHGGDFGQGFIFRINPDGNDFMPIYSFQDEEINFDHASFFEGLNGRLYFGCRKKIGASPSYTYYEPRLRSINKDGSDVKLLSTDSGVSTTCVQTQFGRLYWIDGFSLSRMNADGLFKERSWKKLYEPADGESIQNSRLSLLPNGDLFGGIDYYYDGICGTDSYYDWLAFFLHPDGTVAIKKHNLESNGYVPGPDGKVQRYDYELDPAAFFPVATANTICQPSLSEASEPVAQYLSVDNSLWGQLAYQDGRFDMIAVNTVNKACAYTIPWKQEMGYQGRFAFEKDNEAPSTPIIEVTKESEIKISPNPAQYSITVESSVSEGQIDWKLLDFTGKTVYTGSSNAPIFEVAVNTLPAGVYQLVGVAEKSGLRFSQKVLKQ